MKRRITAHLLRITGCDISPTCIRIVELGKFFNKIDLLHYDEEPLDSFYGTAQAVQLAFRRLYDRNPKLSRDVVLHVEGKGVRHLMMDAPLMDENALKQWISSRVIQRLPEGVSPEDLSISYHILNATEEKYHLWITYCQTRLIEEQLAWAESAGLNMMAIAGGALDVNHAYLFAPDGQTGGTQGIIIIREQSLVSTLANQGQPVIYEESPLSEDSFSSDYIINQCSKRWQETGNVKLDRVIWIDARYLDDSESLLEPPGKKTPWPILQIDPLHGLINSDQTLPPRFGLASSLALKLFFPALNTIDLLPETRKEKVRIAAEKQTVMRWIIGAGGILTISLFILNIIRTSIEQKLTLSEEKVIEFNDQINQIELTKKEQSKLIHTYQDMRHLIQMRSDYARLFEEIGRILPGDMWLQNFSLTPIFEGRLYEKIKTGEQVILQGWSKTDARIAVLISNLESSDRFRNIRLEERTRLSEDAVFKQTERFREPLIHFQIIADVKLSPDNRETMP